MHICMTTHKCTCTQTHSHKQSRTLQQKRGSQATVYTVREEIVKNVSLLGGLFWSESVCQSETNRFRYYLHTIHTYIDTIHTYMYLSAEWQWQQETRGCDMPKKLLKRFSHALHGISHSSKIIGAYLTKIPKTNYELIIYGVYKTGYTKYVQKQLNSRNYIWFCWQFVCKQTCFDLQLRMLTWNKVLTFYFHKH